MSFVQSLIITIAGGAMVSGLSYYLFLRRLYVATRAYTYSALSDTGKTVSFTILNRGHRSETDVKLELDSARRYSLLATSSNDVSLSGQTIQVTRLPARTNVEAVLLVEGGDFDNDKIVRLSSKEAGGKSVKKLEEVPQPPGAAALILLIILGLAGGSAYFAYSIASSGAAVAPVAALGELTATQLKNVESLKATGWENVEAFVKSPLSKAYSAGDFPVKVQPVARVGDFVVLDAAIKNKLDEWLDTTISADAPTKLEPGDCRFRTVRTYVSNALVLANSDKSERLVVFIPRSAPADVQVVRISVTLKTTRESVFDVTRMLDVHIVREAEKNEKLIAAVNCPK